MTNYNLYDYFNSMANYNISHKTTQCLPLSLIHHQLKKKKNFFIYLFMTDCVFIPCMGFL